MYDEDSDSGDISLSIPLSQSSPQLSSILRDTGPSNHRDVPSPTPQRLFGKTLWNRTVSVPVSASSSSSSITTVRGDGSRGMTSSVSLNDDDEDDLRTPGRSSARSKGKRKEIPRQAASHGDEGSEESDLTPIGESTFWGPGPGPGDRPSSARSAADNSPPSALHPFARRTSSSSTLTRSRSLNVRLPSADLSISTDRNGKGPSSATAATPSMRLGWSRRPGEPRPPPLVGGSVVEKMGRWVKEIIVCNFDLERGPVVERRVMGRRWGPGEKENV